MARRDEARALAQARLGRCRVVRPERRRERRDRRHQATSHGARKSPTVHRAQASTRTAPRLGTLLVRTLPGGAALVEGRELDRLAAAARMRYSQSRAYLRKTPNACSAQSTRPCMPSRNPSWMTYMRTKRHSGRKASSTTPGAPAVAERLRRAPVGVVEELVEVLLEGAEGVVQERMLAASAPARRSRGRRARAGSGSGPCPCGTGAPPCRSTSRSGGSRGRGRRSRAGCRSR